MTAVPLRHGPPPVHRALDRPVRPAPCPSAEPAPGFSKYLVPEVVFGWGALSEAGFAARRLGARRPFVVTDAGLVEAGWLAELAGHLDDAGLRPTVWTGLTPNPKDHEVAEGVQRYRESGCDVVVGLGGGSVIDAAKAVAVVASNGGSILDYEGVDRVTTAIPPTVMCPSTAGTGADVSQFAVVTDTTRRLKATLIGRVLVPDISLTDPRLLTTMPEDLAAATGLDALTHGIEAFVSRASGPLTDVHALHAVELICGSLRRTLTAPGDTAATTRMAQASLEAGMAFTNAILGATHAMSHQVGGLLDVPHGVVNGVLLPHVIRFNARAVPERFLPVARAMGVDVTGLSGEEAAEEAAGVVTRLAAQLGCPSRLGPLGVREADVERLATTTLGDACLSTNPRDADRAEIAELFRAAL
ncbi:Alcohol dehydrogenase, class IV [Geodermatophilus saharensis]|uniref:Alcohol dehydrogenase, class IV n=1 Tax=Geodermatophilus saharensis TaxID=1137994 RepID=A0A239B9T3_9ACTN|nr:iron-containing alcohol dehydrogenase [Geodermatophilus saharensis]SNS04707.1 Alcohol dehydrogenase, class IV [Geodermatophilus saharensis]